VEWCDLKALNTMRGNSDSDKNSDGNVAIEIAIAMGNPTYGNAYVNVHRNTK